LPSRCALERAWLAKELSAGDTGLKGGQSLENVERYASAGISRNAAMAGIGLSCLEDLCLRDLATGLQLDRVSRKPALSMVGRLRARTGQS
jgi:hypothetical protein